MSIYTKVYITNPTKSNEYLTIEQANNSELDEYYFDTNNYGAKINNMIITYSIFALESYLFVKHCGIIYFVIGIIYFVIGIIYFVIGINIITVYTNLFCTIILYIINYDSKKGFM